MNEQLTIMQCLQEYGLLGVYTGRTPHGDYPLLHLRGRLSLDLLTLTPHFGLAAAQTGTLADLWAGEQVTVCTAQPGAIDIEASSPELAGLVRQHVTNAAQDVQRTLRRGDFAEVSDYGSARLGGLPLDAEGLSLPNLPGPFGKAMPPEGGLRGLSLEERLDRARALREQTVIDTFDVRALRQTESDQERALLHFPPPRDASRAPETPLPEEDFWALAQQERLMQVEGAGEPNDWLDDNLRF